MKTNILTFSFLLFTFILSAQDTITVQTFTWDSTSRSAVFEFPDVPGDSYRKILMEYNMRCHNAAVGNGNVGCGEWDYHCNTVITDPSVQDSIMATHPSHIISDFNGSQFDYSLNPTYSYTQYTQTDVSYTNISNESEFIFYDDGSATEIGTNASNTKFQFIITANQLQDGAISDKEIQGLKLYFKDEVQVPFLRIRMKNLVDNQDFQPQLDGFTEHYFKSTDLSEGENHFRFYEAFEWDGTSSIMIEISHAADEDIYLRFEGQELSEAMSFISIKPDHHVNFKGTEFFDISTDNFNNIDSMLTISFWSRGDGSLPVNTYPFEGVDADNNRQASSHLPWSNAQIYWDCGNDGTGYDRINKPATEPEFENVWTNWTFIKNVNQLSMTILKNGEVWHTEFGKSKPIDISKFVLGASASYTSGYLGDIDDLRIWNQDVDPFTLKQWMYKDLDDSHPYHDFLIAEFSFSEGSGSTIGSPLTINQGTTNKEPNWRTVRGKDLRKNFSESLIAPKVSLMQGDYTLALNEIVKLDSTINSSNRIITYGVDQNELQAIDTIFYYSAAPSPIFDEDGMQIGTIDNLIDGTIDITTLDYFRFSEARYEILSFITPYGNGLDLGPEGKTYTIDMTDYATILKGAKMMSVEGRGNRQEELDIKFHFIKGTPHAEIREIKQMWPVRGANQIWAGYSLGSIIDDSSFEPRQIFIPEDIGYVKLRSAITGHGSNGEFQSRQHFVNVNGGFEEALYNVWKECGDNPVYPQGGTWIFDRAGWCPGMETDVHSFEIGPFLNKGEYNEFDYGIKGQSGSNYDYRVNNQLVLYEAPNADFDVEILDIINPSTKTEHQRVNPSCNQPNFIFRNSGGELLNSFDITYGMEGGDSMTSSWSGNVRYLDSKRIELEVPDEKFWKSGNGTFYIQLSNPNGQEDQNPDNSYMTSKYIAPFTSGKDLRIDIKTDNKPQDSRINIYDSEGNIALDLFGFGSNSNYSLDLDLPDGCYTMELLDLSDDGLEFWFFPNNGIGWVRITEDNLPTQTFDPDFGGNLYFDFIINKTTSNQQIEIAQSIGISPNPVHENLNIQWHTQTGMNGIAKIINQNGKQLLQKKINSNSDIQIDLNQLASGIYFIRIESEAGIKTKKFIKI